MRTAFADPVLSAQSTFRFVLAALSRPGTVESLSAHLPDSPPPLDPAAAAVALTLCDLETPLWLDPVLSASPEVAAWLRFHAGCPLVERPEQAAFALIADLETLADLSPFAIGTAEYPDRSATLIVQTPRLGRAEGGRLSGPGIKDTAPLPLDGLPPAFFSAWAENGALYPQGVDVIFAGNGAVAGLPRTSRLVKG